MNQRDRHVFEASPAAMAAGLQRLRANRARPERDVRILGFVDAELRRVRQSERATRGASVAWDALIARAGLPGELATRVRVASFRGGVLTVRVPDASTKYALDRALRAGAEAALARLSSTPLRRVKVVLQ